MQVEIRIVVHLAVQGRGLLGEGPEGASGKLVISVYSLPLPPRDYPQVRPFCRKWESYTLDLFIFLSTHHIPKILLKKNYCPAK